MGGSNPDYLFQNNLFETNGRLSKLEFIDVVTEKEGMEGMMREKRERKRGI